jgi:hypothetical protein
LLVAAAAAGRLNTPTGSIQGRCSFNTRTLNLFANYTVRFYRDSQPLPSPSVVFYVARPADACGACGGDNATCAGCDGVPNSGKKLDSCGVCGGSCDDPFAISIANPPGDFQRNVL